MRVRVLTAGVYNGPEHRHPVKAEPGDVIEVAGGWYAAELIEKGLVAEFHADDADQMDRQDTAVAPGENQADAGPTQRKPAEPKGRKVSDLRKLSDALE